MHLGWTGIRPEGQQQGKPMTEDTQNHDALADAVRLRRKELGITQEEAVERSRRIDVDRLDADGQGRKHPGISISTWRGIEQSVPKERRPHTQRLLDLTLQWPEGTARAWLYGLPVPDEPAGSLVDVLGPGADGLASRAETARTRAEVATLRAEVAELADAVARLARAVGDGSGEVVNSAPQG